MPLQKVLLPQSSNTTIMPQHIGIVACSAEGAALCYRTICVEGAQYLGAHAHPEVSMHTHSFAGYMHCIARDHWQGVWKLMLSSANKLAKIGTGYCAARSRVRWPQQWTEFWPTSVALQWAGESWMKIQI